MGRRLLAIAALRLVLGLFLGAGLALAMLALPKKPPRPSAPASAAKAKPPPAAQPVVSYSGLYRIQPDRPLPPGGSAIELRALRGECEGAQIAVAAGTTALGRVLAVVRGSLGDGVELRLYREGIVRLPLPSGPEGHAGAWPDPLIPERDSFAGETREAFPFDVPARENRVVYVEVCVADSATPGVRQAAIEIRRPSPPNGTGTRAEGTSRTGKTARSPSRADADTSSRAGDGPRSDAPRSDAARSDAARSDAARSDAPRTDAPRTNASRTDATSPAGASSPPDAEANGVVTMPLRLRIERARIPATSSLPTSFGFSSRRAAIAHYGRAGTEEEIATLDRLYRQALLRHRISVHGGTMDPPPFRREKGRLVLDFSQYDAEVGPFLSGQADPAGARATTVELRSHPALKDDGERIRYWAAIAGHHRDRGWQAILFDYGKDEPSRADLPAVAARARLVKKADPSIRTLVTASLEPTLGDAVDVWAPNLNCLWIKSHAGEFCPWRAPRTAYDPLLAKGAMLWWYQSCSSHGCSDEEEVSPGAPQGSGPQDATAADAYFRGWPSYVIDAPGARARIMGWLAFGNDIGGELYFDTVRAFSPDGTPHDPWDGRALRGFGGNGEGTLLYPGTPARIGGATHVPVSSLRLLQIRDGLEDYELLRLVAATKGGAEVARQAVRDLAPAPFRVRDDPEALERARGRLLDHLAKQEAPTAE